MKAGRADDAAGALRGPHRHSFRGHGPQLQQPRLPGEPCAWNTENAGFSGARLLVEALPTGSAGELPFGNRALHPADTTCSFWKATRSLPVRIATACFP